MDRVFLSLWLQRWDASTILRAFEKTLQEFPLSRTKPGIRELRIQPVDWSEPPAAEHEYDPGITPGQAAEACREMSHPDCAYQALVFWDVGGAAYPVKVVAYGPDFAGRDEEHGHLEIELGREALFLEAPENATQIVFLVRHLEASLKLERREVWTESGETFAGLLAMVFGSGAGPVQ